MGPQEIGVFLFLLVLPQCLGSPLVDTEYGMVMGTTHDFDDERTYDAFLSIPFARAPVDDLRFAPPQEPEPWHGVYHADTWGPHCHQIVAPGYILVGLGNETSEDCLHLSVWVPGGVDDVSDLPVMVWYYGGAYILGTHAMYDGHELAVRGNVIVVGFNYRIGSLGFLYTGDDNSPGNYGLMDARAALTWVKNNIRAFGGDPDQVTIFGQSAGGCLVSHSMINPHMQDLFQRGIAISGASHSFVGITTNVSLIESGKLLGRLFRCRAGENMARLVNCLRDQDARLVDFWGTVGTVVFRQQLPNFMPVVDGDFIPQDPFDSWEEGWGSDKDFITGHTHMDAAMFVLLGNETYGWAENQGLMNFTLNLILNGYGNPQELHAILYERFPDLVTDDDFERCLEMIRVATDWWFASGSHFEAGRHSRNPASSTYMYDYFYRNSFIARPEWVIGSHVDDLWSVFGEAFVPVYREGRLGNFSEADLLVSENLVNYYTNFVYTGDPNNGPHEVPTHWEQFVEEDSNYMILREDPEMAIHGEDDLADYHFFALEWPQLTEPKGPDNDTGIDLPTIIPPTDDEWGDDLSEDDWEMAFMEIEMIEAAYKLAEYWKAMAGDDPEVWNQIDEFVEWAIIEREESILSRS